MIVGIWCRCEVDLTMAGMGRIAVDVRGELTRPLVELVERCEGLHTVSFVPQECCLHTIVVTFNGIPVPGEMSLHSKPFNCSLLAVTDQTIQTAIQSFQTATHLDSDRGHGTL